MPIKTNLYIKICFYLHISLHISIKVLVDGLLKPPNDQSRAELLNSSLDNVGNPKIIYIYSNFHGHQIVDGLLKPLNDKSKSELLNSSLE